MIEDSILKEVRAVREAYARLHDFDVHKIVADLRALDLQGDWQVVSFAGKPDKRAPAEPIAVARIDKIPAA